MCTFETSLDGSPFVRLGANGTANATAREGGDEAPLDTRLLAAPPPVTSAAVAVFSVAATHLNGTAVPLAGNVSLVVYGPGGDPADLVSCAGNATAAALVCAPLGVGNVTCGSGGGGGGAAVCNFTVAARAGGGPQWLEVSARNNGGVLDPTPAVLPWLVDTAPPAVLLLQAPPSTARFPSDELDTFVFEVRWGGAALGAAASGTLGARSGQST